MSGWNAEIWEESAWEQNEGFARASECVPKTIRRLSATAGDGTKIHWAVQTGNWGTRTGQCRKGQTAAVNSTTGVGFFPLIFGCFIQIMSLKLFLGNIHKTKICIFVQTKFFLL